MGMLLSNDKSGINFNKKIFWCSYFSKKMLSMLILHQVLFQVSREKYSTGIFLMGFLLEKGNQGKRSCSLPLENLSIFSPFSPCAGSVARGVSLSADSDQGSSP